MGSGSAPPPSRARQTAQAKPPWEGDSDAEDEPSSAEEHV
jgi:hypothetical protein